MTRFCSINWVALAACFIIVMGTPRLGAAALVNGNFETNPDTSWLLTGGSTALNAIVGEPGTQQSNPGLIGSFFYQFGENSATPATLTQNIGPLIVGNNYNLSYYFAADSNARLDLANNLLGFAISGGASFSQNNIITNNGIWQSFISGSFSVTNASDTSVTFSGRSVSGFLGLDNVVLNNLGPAVASVPEPTSMASMGLGLAFMAIRRHRRGRVQGAVESV